VLAVNGRLILTAGFGGLLAPMGWPRRFQASRVANAVRPAVQLDLPRVDFQDFVQREK